MPLEPTISKISDNDSIYPEPIDKEKGDGKGSEPEITTKAGQLAKSRLRRELRIARMRARVQDYQKQIPPRIVSTDRSEDASGLLPPCTTDAFRETCWDLELRRHFEISECERKRLDAMVVVDKLYHEAIRNAEDEYEKKRKDLVLRALHDNSEKLKRVQELRYRLVRDDERAAWQRKHEMSLRGRSGISDQDTTKADQEQSNTRPGKRSRRNNGAYPVSRMHTMNIMQLSPEEVARDVELITGRKRPVEKEPENNGNERKSKRKKQ